MRALWGEVVSGYARIWLVRESRDGWFWGNIGIWVILFSIDCAC